MKVMDKILCIEDEGEIRETIVEELQDAGYETIEAGNGMSGLAMIQKHHPDLVLCDINMPEMGGHELLAKVRQGRSKFADMPFIFLTAFADRTDVKAGLELGADDYLTKPIDFEILLIKVEASLRQVKRMNDKSAREQVKLYRALKQNSRTESAAMPRELPQPIVSRAVDPGFEEHLPKCLHRGQTGPFGRVQLVSLEGMKHIFGKDWSRLSGKAMSIAEGIIKDHLAKQDAWSRYNEDTFLVRFVGIDDEAAGFRIELIADVIRMKLMGEEAGAFKDLPVSGEIVRLMDHSAEGGKVTAAAVISALERFTVPRAAQVGTSAARADPAALIVKQIQVKYHPVWDATEQCIVAYQCRFYRHTPYGIVSGEKVLHGGSEDPLNPDLDLFMASRAISCLGGTAESRTNAAIILVVHYATLFGETRKRLEEILGRVPRQRLLSRLMVEVVGVPDFVSQPRIWEAMNVLTPLCASVSVKISPLHTNVSLFCSAGATSLRLDVDEDIEPEVEKMALKRINKFALESTHLGFKPCVYGVNTAARFQIAEACGVPLMSGKTIAAAIDRPGETYALPKRKFLVGL
jgi:CheY-like chemotaxis protein